MDYSDIVYWARKYDEQYPWWVEKEKEIGEKLRRQNYLTKEDLTDIVEWKFKRLPYRMRRIMKLITRNSNHEVREISHQAFAYCRSDTERINALRRLKGVGLAVASVILSFLDPKRYGVFDTHVWRELFGEEPPGLFTDITNYLKLLERLRDMADEHGVDVRMVEKAILSS